MYFYSYFMSEKSLVIERMVRKNLYVVYLHQESGFFTFVLEFFLK